MGKGQLKPVAKAYREWHYYPTSKRLFVNVDSLGGPKALLLASCDGIGMYKHYEKSEHIFVDVDWIIDENIGDKRDVKQVKRLKEEVLDQFRKVKKALK